VYADSGFNAALTTGAGWASRANVSPNGKMQLLAKPSKMPSMAGFDLEVTGYEVTPPARTA
jgi:hypothetical protein